MRRNTHPVKDVIYSGQARRGPAGKRLDAALSRMLRVNSIEFNSATDKLSGRHNAFITE